MAWDSINPNETSLRALNCDCAPYDGEMKQPVSGGKPVLTGSDDPLREIAPKDLFAVRGGVIKFRGFEPKNARLIHAKHSDSDFRPIFIQKGVDVRIALDIVNYSATRKVDRIALITGDTDFIPAMKHARANGLQVVLVAVPGHNPPHGMREHCDFVRRIEWPRSAPSEATAQSSKLTKRRR